MSIKIKQSPEKQLIQVATREIREIQDRFAALREIGVYTSPWPQHGFSKELGVTVREVQLVA